jgi:integrase/recombinase XerC/integrase/recombinase XerD
MKKTAMDSDGTHVGWGDALRLFDADLRRRGMAEKTRRAYAVDLGQLATWANTQAVGPQAVDAKVLRRYARPSRRQPPAATTVARKLAAIRAFFRVMREHGLVAQNPADLLPAPKRPAKLPRALKSSEVAALLDRIPAATPLEMRDRALFELAYACGLRAEELVNLDVRSLDFDAEEIRVEGKGSKTRVIPVGEQALETLARYLERARPALRGGDGEEALFLSKSGRRLSTSDVRRRLRTWERQGEVAGDLSPHALRHSFATHLLEGGCRLKGHPRALGTCFRVNDPDLHPSRLRAAQVGYARSHPRA